MGTQLKRGISDVVTTVLIILLALASVVIMWTFLRGEIQKGSEEIAGASECLGLELKAKSCTYKTVVSNGITTYNVTVERVSSDNTELEGISLIVDLSDNNRKTNSTAFPKAKLPAKHEIKTSDNLVEPPRTGTTSAIVPNQIAVVSKIKIAQTGATKACAIPSTAVTCTVSP